MIGEEAGDLWCLEDEGRVLHLVCTELGVFVVLWRVAVAALVRGLASIVE